MIPKLPTFGAFPDFASGVVEVEDAVFFGEAEFGTSAVTFDDWPNAPAAAVKVKISAADNSESVRRNLVISFFTSK
jgi:hypothetical protein